MVGHAVISHDPPTGHVQTLEEFFELHGKSGPSLPLALNVKSDGLQDLLAAAIERHGVQDYFLFDMSVPDLRSALRKGLRCFTRQSDLEPFPVLYDQCEGVWVDTLQDDWLEKEHLRKLVFDGKRAAIVSPELHGRPHLPFWEKLVSLGNFRAKKGFSSAPTFRRRPNPSSQRMRLADPDVDHRNLGFL